MTLQNLDSLKPKMSELEYRKLHAIPNPTVHRFVAEAAELCNPDEIFICTDSPEDIAHVREMAVASGEEAPLAIPGHTYHFDGPKDLGRDRDATKYLVPKWDSLSKVLNQIEREEGLAEIRGLLRDSMRGRTMIVRFLSLGPTNSIFSIPCMECTDSWYVSHSMDLLYRQAYELFRRGKVQGDDFFRVLHSAGKLNELMQSVEADKRRIYIDYIENTVYTVNTQYAGNSMGFKKLALRLAIRRAHREGWLAEHMMITGVYGPGGRKTYFAGAFPSACGKTSTAMTPGCTIMGDDIAYLRNINGRCRVVNAEAGIFGILKDVNPVDDPLIWEALTIPGEVIFSNVLVKDGRPYWLGMGCEIPKEGVNYTGRWWDCKTDENGEKIPPAHPNARYTIPLKALRNCDPELDNPFGVELEGIIYGCRDTRAYVPVQQSFNWEHGIVAYGAALETETTFALVEEEGKYEINLMSIQDFVSIPLGKYIQSSLEFGRGLEKQPIIFGVNYFLRDKEKKDFLNDRRDKWVWIKWMELRVHDDVDALISPTGLLPKYVDLRQLFRETRGVDYKKEDYIKQFTIRVPENLAKINRVEKFYRENVQDTPLKLFEILEEQKNRLMKAQAELGSYISPEDLETM
ncbi:MAG: phosphoenolpyruvate carboxykinase (GTP) [Candidatus Bathyarchaeia archaeon]|nr:phosphoenolpyruvate carboxykinase (GTP) [Candidatus Bathyarchaeota archaeon]